MTNFLLLGMLALFLAARAGQGAYPWLSYVVAFAEAAMVGGIADWFAVTALFRRPFGLPIPHTALIPRNKARIATNIAKFTSDNFLDDKLVERKLAEVDIAGAAARHMQDPDQARLIASGLREVLLPLLKAMDDPAISAVARSASLDQLRRIPLAPVLGEFLGAMLAGGHHHAAFDALLDEASVWIPANRPLILEKVQKASHWLIPNFVDDKIAEKLVNGMIELCQEMRRPDSELRATLEGSIDRLRIRLAEDADLRAQLDRMKDDLLAAPAVQDRIESLWNEIRHRMIADLEQPHGTLTALLTQVVLGLGQRMTTNADQRETVNSWLRTIARDLLQSQRPRLVAYIETTILDWNSDLLVDKIEQEVGRDLQFIRINGTLVGGAIGLLIHALGDLRLF
ncbi:DUF445 domain-containing protein [Lacibacterium aquatile]|uniref:DUF445 domain-containing protein n=1 Tax=Lacibacterium aquatile TaxID=1168082 RepID=A0ABW5DX06_9PROT